MRQHHICLGDATSAGGVVVTAILAVQAIVAAEDKPAETARQGILIGGGMAGGAVAEALFVAPSCGPGAVVCAVAIVPLGSLAGSLAAESLMRTADEELEEFAKWEPS